MVVVSATESLSPYVHFDRGEWARLRKNTPLTLSEDDLAQLRGINESVSLDEVADIYLPLSRLLSLYVGAVQQLHAATDTFLGKSAAKVPFILAIAGSVAVGKSTTARILQALLSRWPAHPRVDLVTTDGFLYPNRILSERKLMARKGFPESFDVRRLVRFLADLKSGQAEVAAPVYSHVIYDIVPDELYVVRQPDIVIIEGLNVLQTGASRPSGEGPHVFVSDYFDFSIFVEAEEAHIKSWYEERFLALRERAFDDVDSFFHRFTRLSADEAHVLAGQIWDEINGVNLRENIEPTRTRAHLILEKAADHGISGVRLRKL
ncbi:MAG: type I pantothenate kinase [Dehalococcoidia bacterium]